MSENQAVVIAQPQKKAQSRVREKLGKVSLVAGAVMLPAISQAAEITAIGAGLTDEIDGSKALIITLFSAAIVIIGIFLGFKYLKRGANSA